MCGAARPSAMFGKDLFFRPVVFYRRGGCPCDRDRWQYAASAHYAVTNFCR
jgi:hypothetical protein